MFWSGRQNWSRWSELNRQPTVYDTVALPIELHRRGELLLKLLVFVVKFKLDGAGDRI